MNRKYVFSIVTVLLMICNITVVGQSILTDRPDQTEGSTSVPKGSFQIETGVLIGFNNIDDISRRVFAGPSSLFRVGI